MGLTCEVYGWHLVVFYVVILPLTGWKSVSELQACSKSELAPGVQVAIRALFVQVGEGRAADFTGTVVATLSGSRWSDK